MDNIIVLTDYCVYQNEIKSPFVFHTNIGYVICFTYLLTLVNQNLVLTYCVRLSLSDVLRKPMFISALAVCLMTLALRPVAPYYINDPDKSRFRYNFK